MGMGERHLLWEGHSIIGWLCRVEVSVLGEVVLAPSQFTIQPDGTDFIPEYARSAKSDADNASNPVNHPSPSHTETPHVKLYFPKWNKTV